MSKIIGVTEAIREYLEDEKRHYVQLNRLDNVINENNDYDIFFKRNEYVLSKKSEDEKFLRYCEYLKKVDFLKEIAFKLDKSLVWVYQSLVLDGYGHDVDISSDVYQASLYAYYDVLWMMEYGVREDVIDFEQQHVLVGKRYGRLSNSKKKGKCLYGKGK